MTSCMFPAPHLETPDACITPHNSELCIPKEEYDLVLCHTQPHRPALTKPSRSSRHRFFATTKTATRAQPSILLLRLLSSSFLFTILYPLRTTSRSSPCNKVHPFPDCCSCAPFVGRIPYCLHHYHHLTVQILKLGGS